MIWIFIVVVGLLVTFVILQEIRHFKELNNFYRMMESKD